MIRHVAPVILYVLYCTVPTYLCTVPSTVRQSATTMYLLYCTVHTLSTSPMQIRTASWPGRISLLGGAKGQWCDAVGVGVATDITVATDIAVATSVATVHTVQSCLYSTYNTVLYKMYILHGTYCI